MKLGILICLLVLSLGYGCSYFSFSQTEGNVLSCKYYANCSGSLEEGFSCGGAERCSITEVMTLEEKIELIRTNTSLYNQIKEDIPDWPKPRLSFRDYPNEPKKINKKESSITCYSNRVDQNIFITEGNDIVWCTYIGFLE